MRFVGAVVLVACGHKGGEVEQLAAAGHPVSAVVVEESDGRLRATALMLARTDERDDDEQDEEIPIESLPEAVRAAVEAAYPGATWLEAEHEEGEYGVELVTADGEHIEVEYDEDGNLLESEPADAGDDDDRLARRAFVQGTPEAGSGLRVLGVAVDPGAATVPSGSARFTGSYSGSLACTDVAPASDARTIGGVSQGLAETPGGFEITLLDRTVIVDERTEITLVEDPLEPEDD